MLRKLVLLAVGASWYSLAAAAPEAGRIEFTIDTPRFEVVERDDGQRIGVDGFGIVGEAGKPMLPGKIFALAVPPGAVVTSVGWQANAPVALEGTYSLAATPMARFIAEEDPEVLHRRQSEWRSIVDTAYRSDEPYPTEPVTKVRTAGYRSYQLVDVRVSPFRYRAASGLVEYYEKVSIIVDFELPAGRNPAPYDWIPELQPTAREIIANFDQAQEWYSGTDGGRDQATNGFLIITTDSLVSAVAPLVSQERSKGRTLHVATVEWIDSQYPGFDRAARMRRFVREVYPSSAWGIRDLLLVGQPADVPMRETCQDIGYGLVHTDFYFAELSLHDQDSWDIDGDHCFAEDVDDQVDLYSEINVGRIPWSDPVVVRRICEKSAAYELNQDPSFKKNILVLGSFFWETTDTAVLMEAKLAQPWMADWTVTRMYEDNADAQSVFPYDQPLSYSNAVSAMADGRYAFINWAGHGSPISAHTMGNGGALFVNAGACTFLDDDYPAIVWADSCSTANPAYHHLARQMLGQGAVGYVGSTAVALGAVEWQGPGDGSSQSCDYWFTSKVTSGEMTQGQAHQWALRKLYVDGLWHLPRYEMFEWTLHGNPNLGMGAIVIHPLFVDGFESGDDSAWSAALGG